MPLGIGIGIGAAAGIFAGSKMSGGKTETPTPPQANTTSLTDAATKDAPPNAIQAASNSTAQAGLAAQKQKKKAAAGDTMLTPAPAPGASGTPLLQPKTLIGA